MLPSDQCQLGCHQIVPPVHLVILTARNRVESLLVTRYTFGLRNRTPALRRHAGALVRLSPKKGGVVSCGVTNSAFVGRGPAGPSDLRPGA